MQIYCDLDGVLADLVAGYETATGIKLDQVAFNTPPYPDAIDWKKIEQTRDFYLGLPPMKDMEELWKGIGHLNPIILTGVPFSIPEAEQNKRDWVKKNIGPDVKVIVCASKEKYKHCKPGDLLIDDWEKYKHLWTGAGGHWITHTSAADTLNKLKLHLVAAQLGPDGLAQALSSSPQA